MNLKEVKLRIQSVKNTQKITSAMKLVSAAKLRRAQNAIEGMCPYKEKLDEILAAFLGSLSLVDTPWTVQREAKKVVVVAVSSSSSLCGSFNSNIIREAKAVVEKYIAVGAAVEIYPVGKKIFEAFKKSGYEQDTVLLEMAAKVTYEQVAAVAATLMERFAAGDIDRVELVYTHYHSVARQVPVNEALLPVDTTAVAGSETVDFIIEPSRRELLHTLLPKVITLRLFTALLDSATAEHAARMLAMQVATDNADELIAELVREYNKGRQQAITNELLDIVSGSAN